MATDKRHDWRALCKAVSVEQNSERLRDLLAELLKTMDELDARQLAPQPPLLGRVVKPQREMHLSAP
jgi:hypothetical protein